MNETRAAGRIRSRHRQNRSHFGQLSQVSHAHFAWLGIHSALSSETAWMPKQDCITSWNRHNNAVLSDDASLAAWTPEQIALGRRWVDAWKRAGEAMEKLRRQELRQLDSQKAIALLCGPADYSVPPRAPKSWSGLIEQQRWFKKAAHRD